MKIGFRAIVTWIDSACHSVLDTESKAQPCKVHDVPRVDFAVEGVVHGTAFVSNQRFYFRLRVKHGVTSRINSINPVFSFLTTLMVGMMTTTLNADELPPYEVIDLAHPKEHPILRVPAVELKFPLSTEDKRDVGIVEKRFDTEENMAGVAAPQIGIAKQIIVFSAPENPTLKKWRADFTQTMPKQIWINPSFEPIGTDKREDYEGCFSVGDVAGPVKRFERIQYRAFDVDGKLIEGQAEGFLARIIQHEIEHVRGILYIDHVPEGQLLLISEYREMRRKAMEEETKQEL
jgi:peptide deformylase